MNLKDALAAKIIVKQFLLGNTIYIIICQKCGRKWKLKNIEKLPKTCVKCKCDPFTGPEKKGRPKNE